MVRTEIEIFKDLEKLCGSPGYLHVIAFFCFRDNTIGVKNTISVDDILHQFSKNRLIRTEISVLIGLMLKNDIDTTFPANQLFQQYINKTELLLDEIHNSLLLPLHSVFTPENIQNIEFNPFEKGDVLRESIFYGGESAYSFQYRDFSQIKYKKDEEWFIKNKGYNVDQAISVIESILDYQNKKITKILHNISSNDPESWSLLDGYMFTIDDISHRTGIDFDTVKLIVKSLTKPENLSNNDYNAIDDFNIINAYPILKIDELNFLLFQHYNLVEAFYETPFFWFLSDPSYKNEAMQNRGDFTEEFSRDRLKNVFGKDKVYTNIDIYDNKGNKSGEIDVLAIFADRVIIVQAKSKKMTIEARKGNNIKLKDDFKKAIQESYDQAHTCSILIENEDYKLIDSNSKELHISRKFKEIYPICIISEHYPALHFQTKQFLNYKQTEKIHPPFVMDVFLLDVLTELLTSPLYFLSYINKRALYSEKIFASHELTILSYHLLKNLWVDDKNSMLYLDDDICADLDIAMMVRRQSYKGDKTPKGILTEFKGTFFNQIICDIEKVEESMAVDMGFMLLSIDGDTIEQINNSFNKINNLVKVDGKGHDFTIGIKSADTGLTVHCNSLNFKDAFNKLENHCKLRKYSHKVKSWYGIHINPKSQQMDFFISLNFDWEHSVEMEKVLNSFYKRQQ